MYTYVQARSDFTKTPYQSATLQSPSCIRVNLRQSLLPTKWFTSIAFCSFRIEYSRYSPFERPQSNGAMTTKLHSMLSCASWYTPAYAWPRYSFFSHQHRHSNRSANDAQYLHFHFSRPCRHGRLQPRARTSRLTRAHACSPTRCLRGISSSRHHRYSSNGRLLAVGKGGGLNN